MMPFAHAMLGTLAFPFVKKTKLNFVLCMLLGILPDFDIIIPKSLQLIAHRNLSHTIIPGAIIIGILTLWVFKSFWVGFIPITTHFLGDVVNGTVAIIPNYYVTLNLIASDLQTQAIWTGLVGTPILLFWIAYFTHAEIKKKWKKQ